MEDEGLLAEEKGLQAVQHLIASQWRNRGFRLVKAVRTYKHPSKRVSKLDSQKIDLLVVFEKEKDEFPETLIFGFQIKSTQKSYDRFTGLRGYGNLISLTAEQNGCRKTLVKMCVLIKKDDPIASHISGMRAIFQKVIRLLCRYARYPTICSDLPLEDF